MHALYSFALFMTTSLLLGWLAAIQTTTAGTNATWANGMNTNVASADWIASGRVDAPVESPLNASDLCWSLSATSNSTRSSVYRIGDSSPTPLVSLHYTLIAWNLSASTQCRVLSLSSDRWQLLAAYNASENGQHIAAAHVISSSDHIGFRFSIDANDSVGLDSALSQSCYLCSVSLSVPTLDSDTGSADRIAAEVSGAPSAAIDAQSIALVSACAVFVAVCVAASVWWCRRRRYLAQRHEQNKDTSMAAYTQRIHINHISSRHKTRARTESNSSLQIGDVNPIIEPFAHVLAPVESDNESAASSTEHAGRTRARAGSDHGLSQVVHNTASFVRHAYGGIHERDSQSDSTRSDDGGVPHRRKLTKSIILGDLTLKEPHNAEETEVSSNSSLYRVMDAVDDESGGDFEDDGVAVVEDPLRIDAMMRIQHDVFQLNQYQ